MQTILGISGYYHDSAACLIRDGEIVAASQEERYSRKKHDPSFPRQAISYCLNQAGISLQDLDCIVFYDKPLLKFERLLESYLGYAPKGWGSFVKSMPVWLKEKLYLKSILKKELSTFLPDGAEMPKLLFAEHHQSHAASAFYPSPFQEAAVLCLDGVGEWATSSVWLGKDNTLTPRWEINFPHSLGLLYSAFTYFTGFKVNAGEYKLMGLAPYGEPKYTEVIKQHLIDIKPDGTFRLNMKYFDYVTGLRMTNKKFARLFAVQPRSGDEEVRQVDMDLARSVQDVTEEIVLKLGKTIHQETGAKQLCLAGGVALNCVANGRLLREGPFEDIWIQPASGDAGGALGAAMLGWHHYHQQPRDASPGDAMQGGFLGDSYSNDAVRSWLNECGAHYTTLDDPQLFQEIANEIAHNKVVGWFQGRMEFGPRALGGRSIIGDARSEKMQSIMNLKIKYRESFRPFAPSVLGESVAEIFELNHPSPYMLLVANVREELLLSPEDETASGLALLHQIRSQYPAITHVDNSARVQTVHEDTNPRYYKLIKQFKKLTGSPVIINTSFNVRGEPPVRSPEDAFRCFMSTEMDILVMENCVLYKDQQPQSITQQAWKISYELD